VPGNDTSNIAGVWQFPVEPDSTFSEAVLVFTTDGTMKVGYMDKFQELDCYTIITARVESFGNDLYRITFDSGDSSDVRITLESKGLRFVDESDNDLLPAVVGADPELTECTS